MNLSGDPAKSNPRMIKSRMPDREMVIECKRK